MPTCPKCGRMDYKTAEKCSRATCDHVYGAPPNATPKPTATPGGWNIEWAIAASLAASLTPSAKAALNTSTNLGNICYANCLFMLLRALGIQLTFDFPGLQEAYDKFCSSIDEDASGHLVVQMIKLVTAALPTIDVVEKAPFTANTQDDFWRFCQCLGELTEQISNYGNKAARLVLICELGDVPKNYDLVGRIEHYGAHWSAFLGEAVSEYTMGAPGGAAYYVYVRKAESTAAPLSMEEAIRLSACQESTAASLSLKETLHLSALYTRMQSGQELSTEELLHLSALYARQEASRAEAPIESEDEAIRSSKRSVGEAWTCMTCTFENDSGDFCGVCGASRP